MTTFSVDDKAKMFGMLQRLDERSIKQGTQIDGITDKLDKWAEEGCGYGRANEKRIDKMEKLPRRGVAAVVSVAAALKSGEWLWAYLKK